MREWTGPGAGGRGWSVGIGRMCRPLPQRRSRPALKRKVVVNLPGVGEHAGHCLSTANEASRRAANEASGQTEKAGRRVEQRRQTGGRAAEEEETAAAARWSRGMPWSYR